jgi:YggT family protein
LNAVLYVIYLVAMIYGWLIVARAVMSWFRPRYDSPLFRVRSALVWLTEPYLRLFRRILPTAQVGAVGIDLSALVGLIALFVIAQVVVRL